MLVLWRGFWVTAEVRISPNPCLKSTQVVWILDAFSAMKFSKLEKKNLCTYPFWDWRGRCVAKGFIEHKRESVTHQPLLAQWISFTRCAPFKGVLTEYSIHAPSRGSRKARLWALRGRAVWSWVHIYWRISVYKLIFGKSTAAARAAHLLIIQYFCIQSLVFSVCCTLKSNVNDFALHCNT